MLPHLILTGLVGYVTAASLQTRATQDSTCPCGYLDSNGNVWRESSVSDFTAGTPTSVLQQAFAVETWGVQGTYQYRQNSADNVYNLNGALGMRTQGWSGSGPVYTSEVQSHRDDILYGTFRITAEIPTTPGVCFGFFTFYSNTQEADIEFLSADTNAAHTVHYTNQPGQTAGATETVTLGPNLQTSFNEHRIDWLPDVVNYYLNGGQTGSISIQVPDTPSFVLANVWSNGDPGWTQGPPTADAVATIQNIKLYFNSTSLSESDFNSACATAGRPASCQI